MDGDRERFPRQRGLVQDGLLALDQAVDRHHLAGAHEHDVARPHRVDRHLDQIAAAAHESDARRPLHECRQLTSGTAVRTFLQRVSAGQHQRNHRPCEVLAEHECPAIETSAIASTPTSRRTQRPRDRDRQRDEQERRRGRPDEMGRPVDPEHV